jgi:hypothetical protein
MCDKQLDCFLKIDEPHLVGSTHPLGACAADRTTGDWGSPQKTDDLSKLI